MPNGLYLVLIRPMMLMVLCFVSSTIDGGTSICKESKENNIIICKEIKRIILLFHVKLPLLNITVITFIMKF